MKFWLVLLGALALLVGGSVAIAGTPETPAIPSKASGPATAPKATTPAIASNATAPAVASKAATPQPAVPRVATATTPRAAAHGLIAARGRDAIYLVDPDSGKASRIPGTAKLAQPDWSPDGSLLAVADGSSVYTISPRGGHPRLVLRNASSPSWSADGKRLFVMRSACRALNGCAADDGNGIVMSVRPDGSDARPVDFEAEEVANAGEPAFPPDGNWIAFYADEGANPASFDSSAAAWSPDATQLAFVSESTTRADASAGLWVVAAGGGKPELLMSGIYGRPSWGTPSSAGARPATSAP